MHVEPTPATAKGPADRFTGDVWVDAIATRKADPSRMIVSRVRFAPGSRTAWHSHPVGQTLHVLTGVALMQARGGPVIEVHPGQTVYTPPGEEHWHGASPDDFMEHLAMLEVGEVPDAWGDHVSDTEYHRP